MLIDQPKDDNKEERKRKRRSRWSDSNTKIPDIEANVSSDNRSNATLSQPGIAIPAQIGQPAVIIPPPSKGQHIKSKNPMLTKISRNDPALIQYAKQTFGTLDLSEEQWKKAEDHYKVNYCCIDHNVSIYACMNIGCFPFSVTSVVLFLLLHLMPRRTMIFVSTDR